jgi:DNA-binding SARP family transcriptional activator
MPSTTSPGKLRLLGGADLEGPAAHNELLSQSKAVALLALLTVPSPGRFLRRDLLVALLWPELDDVRARAALRRVVHSIRSTLGDATIIGRGDEEIAVDATALTSDAADFMRAAESGQLKWALELYRDDLLPGFHLPGCQEFDQWLEQQRLELRERASGAAWALAQRHEDTNQLTDAALMARRSVRFDWSDERALRRALSMLERLGDRGGASKLYAEFERRLRESLDVAPSNETRELISRIRNG